MPGSAGVVPRGAGRDGRPQAGPSGRHAGSAGVSPRDAGRDGRPQAGPSGRHAGSAGVSPAMPDATAGLPARADDIRGARGVAPRPTQPRPTLVTRTGVATAAPARVVLDADDVPGPPGGGAERAAGPRLPGHRSSPASVPARWPVPTARALTGAAGCGQPGSTDRSHPATIATVACKCKCRCTVFAGGETPRQPPADRQRARPAAMPLRTCAARPVRHVHDGYHSVITPAASQRSGQTPGVGRTHDRS